MNVLVVGGSGNIGSYVVRDLLDHGFDVTTFDRVPPPKMLQAINGRIGFVEGDVGNPDQVMAVMQHLRPQRVVNVAAMLAYDLRKNPTLGMRINVMGAANVLEAACASGVERLVFASTDAVCGEDGFARREDAPMGQDMSVYACTKLLGERLGVMYGAQHGVRFIALRYSLTFGPSPVRGSGVAQAFARLLSALDGNAMTISDFSADWRQQVTYVRDIASATTLALMHESPSYQAYNVAGPYENYMSMREVHAVLRTISPATGEVNFTGPKRFGGPCDISRIQDDLGYQPRYPLAASVRDRIEEISRWS